MLKISHKNSNDSQYLVINLNDIAKQMDIEKGDFVRVIFEKDKNKIKLKKVSKKINKNVVHKVFSLGGNTKNLGISVKNKNTRFKGKFDFMQSSEIKSKVNNKVLEFKMKDKFFQKNIE